MDKRNIKLAKGITIEKSYFDKDGGMLNFNIPKVCDLVILCGNKGEGYKPYKCLLPHQVYLEDIKKAFEEYGFEVITLFPVKSNSNFNIAYNGKYGEKRWE